MKPLAGVLDLYLLLPRGELFSEGPLSLEASHCLEASQLSLRGGADKDHCLLNNNNSILIRSFETVSPGVVEARSPGTQKLLIKASLQRIHVLNLRRKNSSF